MAIVNDLKLPENLRNQLKESIGPVVSGSLPEKYLKNKPLIAVGDYVNDVLYQQGVVPDVGIIDGKTRRGDYDGDTPAFEGKIEVNNPPAQITVQSWRAIEKGISSENSLLIMVKGEEDLLAIASMVICPEGGIVLYGIPLKGMSVNVVDKDKKEKAWQVINSMEKVNQGG